MATPATYTPATAGEPAAEPATELYTASVSAGAAPSPNAANVTNLDTELQEISREPGLRQRIMGQKSKGNRTCMIICCSICVVLVVVGAIVGGVIGSAVYQCETASQRKVLMTGTIPGTAATTKVELSADDFMGHVIEITGGAGLPVTYTSTAKAPATDTLKWATGTMSTTGGVALIKAVTTQPAQNWWTCMTVESKVEFPVTAVVVNQTRFVPDLVFSGKSPVVATFKPANLGPSRPFNVISTKSPIFTMDMTGQGVYATKLDVDTEVGGIKTTGGNFGDVVVKTKIGGVSLSGLTMDGTKAAAATKISAITVTTEVGAVMIDKLVTTNAWITVTSQVGAVSVTVPVGWKGSYVLKSEVGAMEAKGTGLVAGASGSAAGYQTKSGTIGGSGGTGLIVLQTETGAIKLNVA